jgi:uncharacterized protein (TIGR02569 family)
MSRQPPPPPVLAAFGAAGSPLAPLAGGRGTSWSAGDVVIKPLDVDERQLAWQADVLASIRCVGFRVARPRSTADGAFVVDGWCAWERLAGRHEARRWPEIIAVGERLHSSFAGVARPAFLDERTDPWAIGDRVAWGELPADEFADVPQLPRLVAARRPVAASSQLLHGDLTGNILFADGLAPAVIDLSPYWRPTPFASAIVVADALAFEGADERILDAVGHIAAFGQFLVRAVMYRAVTDRLVRHDDPDWSEDRDPWAWVAELACRLAADR